MPKKIKSEWVDMRVNGWLAWIHHFVMLVTFPIRRFWQIVLGLIVVCILLAIIPLYYGVGFKHITRWYKEMIATEEVQDVKEHAKNAISDGIEHLKDALPEKEEAQSEEKRRFAVWKVPEIKKAKYKPAATETAKRPKRNSKEVLTALVKKAKEKAAALQAEDAKSEATTTVSADLVVQQVEMPYKNPFYNGNLEDYYNITDNHSLVYLKKPVPALGQAEVVGPNSLYVDNIFMFLYGIYSDPNKYDVVAAENYLRELTANKIIRCEIVAYAEPTQTATALCFVNGVFINKSLVNSNFAQNIALK